MKKLLMICLAAAMTGCGIYKSYERPEIVTDGLYGAVEASDASLGDLAWREVFADPQLQRLIATPAEHPDTPSPDGMPAPTPQPARHPSSSWAHTPHTPYSDKLSKTQNQSHSTPA